MANPQEPSETPTETIEPPVSASAQLDWSEVVVWLSEASDCLETEQVVLEKFRETLGAEYAVWWTKSGAEQAAEPTRASAGLASTSHQLWQSQAADSYLHSHLDSSTPTFVAAGGTDAQTAARIETLKVEQTLVVPLHSYGQILGGVEFLFTHAESEATFEVSQLAQLGWLVASSWNSHRQREDAREVAAQHKALRHVQSTAGGAKTHQQGVSFCLQSICEAFHWDCGLFFRYDMRYGSWIYGGEHSAAEQPFLERMRAEGSQVATDLFRQATQTQHSLCFEDFPSQHPGSLAALLSESEFKSAAVLPIFINGSVFGCMFFTSSRERSYTAPEQDALDKVAEVLGKVFRGIREAQDLAERVNSVLNSVTRAAGGDLSVSLDVDGEDPVGQIAGGIDELINQLRASMDQIREGSHGLNTASKQLSRVSRKLSDNAHVTADRSNSATGDIDTISSGVRKVVDRAGSLEQAMSELGQDTLKAVNITQKAVEVSREAHADMETLSSSSEEVRGVVKLINDIAAQTNLLALNASIEAARAGEAGKGFAVVAGEVKTLAMETAKATDEIERRIENIQAHVSTALQGIDQVSQTIQDLNDVSSHVAERIEEENRTAREIDRHIKSVADGAENISRDVRDVVDLAADTYTEAQQVSEASEDLAGMASELDTLVSGFRI